MLYHKQILYGIMNGVGIGCKNQVRIMIDEELFDIEYCAIGKTFAKSAGVVSVRDVQTFFSLLDDCRNRDWQYISNGMIVEWCNEWNLLDNIKSHSIFRIMPVAVIPPTTLSDRMTQFSAMPSKQVAFCEAKGKWFGEHSLQRKDEEDSAFEYRIIRTLVALFNGIKRRNLSNCNP